MDKIYRLLEWLTLSQAVDWLETLTETKITEWNLLQLCESEQCAAFIKYPGLDGVSNDFEHSIVSAKGMQKVLNPLELLHCGEHHERRLELYGVAWAQEITDELPRNDAPTKEITLEWSAKTPMHNCFAMFKRTDIESLAAKMNGTAEYAAEISELRQQLEQVSATLKAAETELLQRRSQDGLRNLDKMRHALMHDHKEFSAMQRRAEQAELIAASTERQLTELREQQHRDAALIAKMAEQLGRPPKDISPGTQAEIPTTGITFSRPTKSLKAAHAASIKFWNDYDHMRPPLQKQIASFIKEQGIAERQATALAIAIKPDDLRD